MDRPFPAYAGDEPYAFVCYAHGDAATVYPELSWLRDQDINLWYDEGISPGSEFPETLGKAIGGASLLVFYVSPNSVGSRHCRDEVFYALERDVPVLALYLAETELSEGLALSLGTSQALPRYELAEDDYRRRLVAGIRDLEQMPQAAAEPPALAGRGSRGFYVLAGVLVLAALGYGGVTLRGYLAAQEQARWARYEALPAARDMVEHEWRDFIEPYELVSEAAAILPDDPEVLALLDETSVAIDLVSDPPDADVYLQRHDRPYDEWTYLGRTPMEDVRLGIGFYRWRLEKAGFNPVEALHSTWQHGPLLQPNDLHRRLDPIGSIPPDMVRVAGGASPLGRVPDFFIDRFEVTNRQFKAFMDAGGYSEPRFWQHEFRDQGIVLSREEAMAEFVDLSGRPGPSTWLGGTYPDGEGDHPVSGVSWFEAAAYAEYVGRSLPTSVHWGLARGDESTLIEWPQLGGLGVIAPYSNFSGEGTVPVGSLPGITTWGAYDLAGNVAEWCSNATPQGRIIRGGAYHDNTYEFGEASNVPPMTRTAGMGFRTALLGDDVPEAILAHNPVRLPSVAAAEPPVSDEVFAAYLERFAYDNTPLNAVVESRDTTSEQWVLERVMVDAAYDDERMAINLFLPTGAEPPYQAVVYFPGSGSVMTPSSEQLDTYFEFPTFLSFLVRSGRAVVYPVYKGTFERREERLVPIHYGSRSNEYANYMVKLVKDFRRTVDFLTGRPDIDADKLAYYGMSWGGLMGAIVPAVEDRLQTSVLLAAGLPDGTGFTNPRHYLPRNTLPTLIMVGRYDTMLGYEGSALPFYRQLGTPAADKVIKVYETDHIPDKREFVTETLTWLDDYLGTPER